MTTSLAPLLLRALVPESVDLESARRALEQAAVEQRVPKPRFGEWWGDLLTRIAEFVAGIFDLSSSAVRGLLTFAAWGLIAAAAILLLGWAASVLRRRRAPSDVAASRGVTASVALEEATEMDWERRLRDALAGARVADALRAQWQVLFARMRMEPLRTASRQQTARALRSHFRATSARVALGRLERWTYGDQHPAIEELRALRAEFDRVLPRRVEIES